MDGLRVELAVAAVAALLYLPSLSFGFVFDDLALIDEGGAARALGGSLPYRPVRWASYLVDTWLGGAPSTYHAHNVALHAFACALVARVARRLGAGALPALVAGLVVAVHPFSVEAAAYVAGRRDLLAVVFGLASLLAMLGGRAGLAVAGLLLAAGAKESGLVFAAPVALAVVAGLEADGVASPRRRTTGRAALGAVALATGACVALVLAYGATGPWAPSLDANGAAWTGRIAAHYVAGLAGLRDYAPEYGALSAFAARLREAAPGAVAAGIAGVAALAAALVSSLVWLLASSGRPPAARGPGAFAAAWLATTLAAVSLWGGLHEPGADRHGFLLLAPFAVAVALLLERVAVAGARASRAVSLGRAAAVGVVVAVALGASAARSREQMQAWSDERALWGLAVAQPGPSARAHGNWARIVAGDGKLGRAARHLGRAIAADPADPLPRVGRAAVRCAQRRPHVARRDLDDALRLGADRAVVDDIARDCPAREAA